MSLSRPLGEANLVCSWPTSGTRACLVESIAGLARNAAEHGQAASFLVASDGEGEGLAPGITEGLADIERRFGFPVEVCNRASRAELFGRLGADFDRELLEYALLPSPDGMGWGCNVNFSLLKAAGKLLVSTDDDIFCLPGRLASRRDALAGAMHTGATPTGATPAEAAGEAVFSREYYPGELFYCRDRGALLAEVEPTEVDVLGAYRRFLGAEASGLLDSGSDARQGGRVLVASPGSYGDSAMGSSNTILSLEGAARERLISGGYEGLRYSRELIRIPPRDAVSKSTQLMMTETGFDDRASLPPFLPYGRNPDGLAAVLIRLLYPESLTAYLDFGLLHSSEETRSAGRFELCGYRPHLSALVMAVAVANRPDRSVADPADRFLALGKAIAEAGALKPGRFVDLVHGALSPSLQAYAESLEGLLDRHGRSPGAWAADVEEHLGAVNAALSEPTSLFGEEGCGLSIEQVSRHFDRYGRLLAVWPALHAACAAACG